MDARPRTNWAGNVAFGAPDFYRPAAVSELQAAVARAARIRALATGHSFTDLADSPGAREARHPVPGVLPDACTGQLGLPGRWYDRLPHFRPELRPSVGHERLGAC